MASMLWSDSQAQRRAAQRALFQTDANGADRWPGKLSGAQLDDDPALEYVLSVEVPMAVRVFVFDERKDGWAIVGDLDLGTRSSTADEVLRIRAHSLLEVRRRGFHTDGFGDELTLRRLFNGELRVVFKTEGDSWAPERSQAVYIDQYDEQTIVVRKLEWRHDTKGRIHPPRVICQALAWNAGAQEYRPNAAAQKAHCAK